MNSPRLSFRSLKPVVVVTAGLLLVGGVFSVRGRAFNPVPEPPGFGLVTLVAGQSIRVNVVCSEHGAGHVPPGPCAGELMFHDAAGNTLASQRYALLPGQSASLPLTVFRESGDPVGPVGYDPCVMPSSANRGFAIPSVEVFSTDTGRTMLFINPAAARLSWFGQAPPEPERGR